MEITATLKELGMVVYCVQLGRVGFWPTPRTLDQLTREITKSIPDMEENREQGLRSIVLCSRFPFETPKLFGETMEFIMANAECLRGIFVQNPGIMLLAGCPNCRKLININQFSRQMPIPMLAPEDFKCCENCSYKIAVRY